MNFDEFEPLLERARGKFTEPSEFPPFDFIAATAEQIETAEAALGVSLPEDYKRFMQSFGGGQFLFLDLLPVVSSDPKEDDLLEGNAREPSRDRFVSIAPVGTGDWWGFAIANGACEPAVSFWDHEDGTISLWRTDYLQFLADTGLSYD